MKCVLQWAACFALACVCCRLSGATPIDGAESDGWTPKFYDRLEAAGDVVFNPTGYRNEKLAIGLKWTDGLAKFGAAKAFELQKGSAEWTVSAQVKGASGSCVGVAVEFFDNMKRTLGVVEGNPCTPRPEDWSPMTWKVLAPDRTYSAEVHLLSLGKPPVAFACIEVSAASAPPKTIPPLSMRILPVEWNRVWNGGLLKMQNFSDAPIPFTVLIRARRGELTAPVFELDIPAELELKEAFCPHLECYGHEVPTSTTLIMRENRRCVRYRFESLRIFANEKVRIGGSADAGSGVSIVVGPKAGGMTTMNTCHVTCRLYDGERLYDERDFDMAFRPVPSGLRQTKDFSVFCWRGVDRRIPDDIVLKNSLKAYEAAGIRVFRPDVGGESFLPRFREIRRMLDARQTRHDYSVCLGRHSDMWELRDLRLTEEQLRAMGGNLSKTSDADGFGRRANKICPTFFTTSPELRSHVDKTVAFWLSLQEVKDGDVVTLDMEPWQSDTYCFCDRCLKAFGDFAKLGRTPTMEEARGMPDAWAEFRVRQNAASLGVVCAAVKRYNRSLRVFDYDYVIKYGDPENRARFILGCAKDSEMDELWIDGHLCSYYHKVDRIAFDSMKNNVRHLKKPYIPLGAIAGVESWLRAYEVLSPRQICQFALAAFVNGCPGYGFYTGSYIDGEILLAMMKAQDIAARYEDLPWGKVDGKTIPVCESEQFVYASTIRPDGSEVVALFNYDSKNVIRVDVAGTVYEISSYGTRFIEVRK